MADNDAGAADTGTGSDDDGDDNHGDDDNDDYCNGEGLVLAIKVMKGEVPMMLMLLKVSMLTSKVMTMMLTPAALTTR